MFPLKGRRRRASAAPGRGEPGVAPGNVADPPVRSTDVAHADIAKHSRRPFSLGTRPVIRWIKGDGEDDEVTRSALAAATRIFGQEVDYCLCTVGVSPERARDVLAWAAAPVEWWPVEPSDNPDLAEILLRAGAPPHAFGYWWKWFPERVRPDAPEWILDGDMVVVARPGWSGDWMAGRDPVRISAEDSSRHGNIYGAFEEYVDQTRRIYSGLASLPPGLRYLPAFTDVLRRRPLTVGHDGRVDMCEQGVVAAAFQELGAVTFPLAEFPFARAFEEDLDHGAGEGDRAPWGYHFGAAFRGPNHHFTRLSAEGVVPAGLRPDAVERYTWLTGFGQWGVPGWSLGDECIRFILGVSARHAGSRVLEIGTSRGHLTAMLAEQGCVVTTVDHVDRGAGVNLAGLGVEVVVADGEQYLAGLAGQFDLVVIDVHGNTEAAWRRRAPLLARSVRGGGRIVIDNFTLHQIPEWSDETGVAWLVANLPDGLAVEESFPGLPGVVVLRRD